MIGLYSAVFRPRIFSNLYVPNPKADVREHVSPEWNVTNDG